MKKFTATALVLMMILCGCGQKNVPIEKSIDSDSEGSVLSAVSEESKNNSNLNSTADTDTSEILKGKDNKKIDDSNTDTNIKKSAKDSYTKGSKVKSEKKNTDSDKNKKGDTHTAKSKTSPSSLSSRNSSQTASSQNSSYTVGGSDDPIRNIAPENVQQYIIEEPSIMTEPEPESTYVNRYENVDPKGKVNDSWFDDCVIIGDSLTVGLSMYNDVYNCFGDAKFVCASSLSYWNSQWDLYAQNNVHPYYNGQKIMIEDAAVVTGAKKAIITLGMNDIGIWGSDGTIDRVREVLGKIRGKSPDLRIYFQTVTPMIYGSQKAHLNNQLIREFNSNLRKFAEEQGCGFLNSYEAFSNSNGNLPYDLCSDPGGLGLHFNFTACGIWTEFIKANIGDAYPEPEPESDSEIESEIVSKPVVDTELNTDSEDDSNADKILTDDE